ncbi:HlyU family transcriptional regulator [Jannaschia seohaensis]|uniref:Transcriptional activator HlyU n=1 Tax=Jannaschia seohaensis TaxID=475081 RepID=A0A2Y9B5Q5_9RHOB|nr:HlyU family transcriptional regulator [Jannaschia seohaensis]PWJ10340.1 hypothetical protein BCF38_12419 [Jannaschia seohaensis]SSA51740.1 hypothetical protein SAMN05421539_12419 [Jannaschia seohaensis]
MSWLSKIFGGAPSEPEPLPAEEYKGFAITPAPQKTSDGFRIAATIERDGKTHHMIRADTLRDHDGAVEATMLKAKQVIDQQGDRIFL